MEINFAYETEIRDVYCGEIGEEHVGCTVILNGWVHKWRDLGNLIFIDLRDVTGIAQVVFSADDSEEYYRAAAKLRNEFVISVRGTVRKRPDGMVNKEMKTGMVEVQGSQFSILNTSKTPPFLVAAADEVKEETRLEYRYIDLRSERMLSNLQLRHRVTAAAREYLNQHRFLEIETPMLMKSTPEGARDYIVPSRIHPGKFYALPQSPQLYKQMLMISGVDRYYQIARCFRDEDLRGDKQPEHTQIDIEMSFAKQDDIFTMAEGLFQSLYKAGLGIDLEVPFTRIPYSEAMDRFGCDKPDIRFGLELVDCAQLAEKMEFGVFQSVLQSGGIIKGLRVPNGAAMSRKDIQNWENDIKTYYHAKGLAWVKVDGEGVKGPIAKFLAGEAGEFARELFQAEDNDLLLFVAGNRKMVYQSMADLRLKAGAYCDCIPKGTFKFAWIVDFPLFEWDDETEKWEAAHHLFSMPRAEDIHYLEESPEKVHGQLYDLVLNGVELASGSIRIHNRELQERIFRVVGMSPEEADQRFGFFLKALEYGAPPHGGIAPGLDRILMIMAQEKTIRDVIPFPKTLNAVSPLDGSPSSVEENQLKEVHIKVRTDLEK